MLVFAVSESVISYQDYAVKLPVTEQLTDQTVQHYHPAVQQAAASKVIDHAYRYGCSSYVSCQGISPAAEQQALHFAICWLSSMPVLMLTCASFNSTEVSASCSQ